MKNVSNLSKITENISFDVKWCIRPFFLFHFISNVNLSWQKLLIFISLFSCNERDTVSAVDPSKFQSQKTVLKTNSVSWSLNHSKIDYWRYIEYFSSFPFDVQKDSRSHFVLFAVRSFIHTQTVYGHTTKQMQTAQTQTTENNAHFSR